MRRIEGQKAPINKKNKNMYLFLAVIIICTAGIIFLLVQLFNAYN